MPATFFNAHHSPVGAFASFTLGMKGKKGGFGIGLNGPADQNVYIGLNSASQGLRLLPFFAEGAKAGQELDDYGNPVAKAGAVTAFPDSDITRIFSPMQDRWSVPGLTVNIISPAPSTTIPALFVEITVDNASAEVQQFVFGFEQNHPQHGMRPARGVAKGIQVGREIAIVSEDSGVMAGVGFGFEMIFNSRRDINREQMLGNTGILFGDVQPGEKRTFRLVVAFHQDGIVTSGIETRYAYLTEFPTLESVCSAAVASFDRFKGQSLEFDSSVTAKGLSADRDFQLAHAIRSYYGSTQSLIEVGTGRKIWNVNEGEYRMMNTLDLTADMCFFEMDHHPWTVPSVLELYADNYSYHDEIVRGDERAPGGLSFTHDMGVTNQFSRPGYSSYERAGYDDCFSYMTVEELMNWLGVAAAYGLKQDLQWCVGRLSTIQSALYSLLRRDHPVEAERKGWIQWDTSRCEGGAEITTYDSLDTSLGQARGSGYLAGKMFGICLIVAEVFERVGDGATAAIAREQASLCASAVVSQAKDGVIPAVFEGSAASTIIPHVEGLVWPLECGLIGQVALRYPSYVDVLRTHLGLVLQTGVCKFADGGWKLSSTSDNSWLSKIYVCQHVAERVLDFDVDAAADAAHVEWLVNPQSQYFAWSDQMVNGVAIGSKYYPRGVTAWLWTR